MSGRTELRQATLISQQPSVPGTGTLTAITVSAPITGGGAGPVVPIGATQYDATHNGYVPSPGVNNHTKLLWDDGWFVASFAFVTLQASSPGTPDTGNFNVSGAGIVQSLSAAEFDLRTTNGTAVISSDTDDFLLLDATAQGTFFREHWDGGNNAPLLQLGPDANGPPLMAVHVTGGNIAANVLLEDTGVSDYGITLANYALNTGWTINKSKVGDNLTIAGLATSGTFGIETKNGVLRLKNLTGSKNAGAHVEDAGNLTLFTGVLGSGEVEGFRIGVDASGGPITVPSLAVGLLAGGGPAVGIGVVSDQAYFNVQPATAIPVIKFEADTHDDLSEVQLVFARTSGVGSGEIRSAGSFSWTPLADPNESYLQWDSDFYIGDAAGARLMVGGGPTTPNFAVALTGDVTTVANVDAASFSSAGGVPYVLPATNGAGVLTNDGAGNLSWT